ncbi:MAG: transposase, partial [Opitutales bacterium]
SMIDMEQAHGLRMLVPPTHQDYKEKQRYASDHPREIEKRYKDKLMRRLKTPQGRAIYQKRNTVVEGGFANIKHAIGLNQFRMKGLEGVGIEWLLGSIAYNCRKITSMA